MSERYYPAQLVRVYFKTCAVKKVQPTFEGMHEFIAGIQGEQQYNGINIKSIGEVFNGIPYKR